MNAEEVVRYWLDTAAEDWKVAQHLFESGDYSYSLFFGHLYLEKMLKAIVVQRTQSHAPFIHDLLRLAKSGELSLTEKQEALLDQVTAYNLEARYPDYKSEFKRRCTEAFCKSELKRIEEMGRWIKAQIR